MSDEACAEMPRYKCRKEVWALKIANLEMVDGGVKITPSDKGYAPFIESVEYFDKHNPKVGGYYVVYKDGYKSWSPGDVFEEGYSAI